MLAALLVLLIFSAFSSGSETGMMASNKVKLRNLSKKSKGAKRALLLLKRPDILLASILVGNNFANILASALVTILMIDYFDGNVLLGSVILTLIILIFSEITPKTIASVHPENFAIKSSWTLKGLVWIFKPLVWLTNIVSSRLLKLLNVDPMESASNDNLNSDELRTLLDEHGELIPNQSRAMLSSILGMEELTVEDIMTSHAEIMGIDLNQSIEAAQKVITSSYYSRLPVFKGSIDSIVGMLHLKDSHQFIEALEQKLDVSKILLETTFISQSTTLSKQLNQFQKQDNNLGLVVDEYGEIQGLLTIEDIFNEIVGKFGAAKKELEKEFIQKKDGSVIADGNSKIRDLNNYVGWDLDEDGSKTINGAIIDHLDQIPQENVCLELGLYRIEVLQIEENFIAKVKINKKGS
ncbi:CNNM domain-containing protein [Gammaproteobacteria bacterium]|nr:CNNM domain-containing protein [Gammaproteobacteria bacterium]MDB9907379.1 CNNM domain-containing protein [Gammaproteobacteria bacterium]MDC1277104.1 CNNM domain-containing protein [Gammaproteobacteria bacterium]